MTLDAGQTDGLQRLASELSKALEKIQQGDILSANFAKIHLFGSNHFRRCEELEHLRYINSQNYESNEAPFRLDTFQPDRPKYAIFIGDSHAEFGCRLPTEEPAGCDFSTFNYWLGPITMMGLLTNPSSFEEIASVICKANDLHSVATQRSVVFSFGEIDIRHVVYQFITRQTFRTVEDYTTFLRPLLQRFFSRLTSRFPGNTFFMLQPIPTSRLKPYGCPTNVAAMATYYEKFGEHPALGSPEMRYRFWSCIDAMTSQICDLQSVNYLRLPTFYFEEGYLNPSHTGDNTHISSLQALKAQELQHQHVLFPA